MPCTSPSDQLSLAIGREGQNVRLAARLTGWKIDIKNSQEYDQATEDSEVAELISQKKKKNLYKEKLNGVEAEQTARAEEDARLRGFTHYQKTKKIFKMSNYLIMKQ